METANHRLTKVSSPTLLDNPHLFCRWECARDWKTNNPKGTQKAFEAYWAEVERDKGQLQVISVLLSLLRRLTIISLIRHIKIVSRCTFCYSHRANTHISHNRALNHEHKARQPCCSCVRWTWIATWSHVAVSDGLRDLQMGMGMGWNCKYNRNVHYIEWHQ